MAKKGSTILLKITLVVIGLIALAFGIFALPSAWNGGPAKFPAATTAIRIIIIGMYVTVIPYFIGLYETWKLLNYIERGQAFSELSVKALKNIKLCAALIGLIYLGGVPLLFPIAEADDAPGLVPLEPSSPVYRLLWQYLP